MPSLIEDYTRLLFWKDPYITKCKAKIVAITKEGIILDQTVFFPAGGGQASDKGTIQLMANGQICVNVNNVEKIDQKIIHKITEKRIPFSIGDQVIATINWQRRYQIMKAHTSQHILSAMIVKNTGIQTQKAIIEESEVTIHLEKEMSQDDLKKSLIETNKIIFSNKLISTLFHTKNELSKKETTNLRGHLDELAVEKIRIVTIADIDNSLCGGTHCKSTSEIGIVSLLDFKGDIISYVVSEKAVEHIINVDFSLITLAKELSVKKIEVPQRITKLLNDFHDQEKVNIYLSKEVVKWKLEEAKRSLRKIGEITVIESVLPHIDRRTALLELGPLEENVLVLLVIEGPILLVLSSIKEIPANKLIAEINEQFGGKGGGSPTIAQTTIKEEIIFEDFDTIITKIIK